MGYFIFAKNLDNTEGTLYRIAENQSDLDNLNIVQSAYKIIETSQSNFDSVKFGNSFPIKYNNDDVTFIDTSTFINNSFRFERKEHLQFYIDNFKKQIKIFTDVNLNHPLYSRWNDYSNQLNSLNLDTIEYPMNKSLEQYFNDQNQPSFNALQVP